MKVERLDEHAQPLIADLYGLDAVAFTLISHWYKQRAKRSRHRNLPGLKRVQRKTNPLAPPRMTLRNHLSQRINIDVMNTTPENDPLASASVESETLPTISLPLRPSTERGQA